MENLIISIDILTGDIGQNDNLGKSIRKFFRILEEQENNEFHTYTYPTSDGVILVWEWDSSQENTIDSVLFEELMSLLKRLEKWTDDASRSIRLGIHSANLEHITYKENTEVYGGGLKDCVSYMKAAEQYQVIISSAALTKLKGELVKTELTLGKRFPMQDGKMHRAAYSLSPKESTFWSIDTPDSARKANVDLELRGEEEKENNKHFSRAQTARVVAMTYKSLGNTLSKKELKFPHLEAIQLIVYACPNLINTHPVFRYKSKDELVQEWKTGLTNTISAFLDANICPQLKDATLTIISVPASLTATDILIKEDDDLQSRLLRITPVVTGSEMAHFPTISIRSRSSSESSPPAFKTLLNLVDNLSIRQKQGPTPLTYILKRGNYMKHSTNEFVEKISAVSADFDSESRDRSFNVKFAHPKLNESDEPISHYHIAGLLEGHRRKSNLNIEWNKNGSQESLMLSDSENKSDNYVDIQTPHILAAFVLMTYEQQVILVDYKKGIWDYDVPGGKVNGLDNSCEATVVREVFEELNFDIEESRLQKIDGCVYDAKSAKEGKPVVAQYFQYKLNNGECDHLMNTLKTSTKNQNLAMIPLDYLLKEKLNHSENLQEAICHAPLGSIEQLTKNM